MNEQKARRIVIVGGGAAGFFAAINAAEQAEKQNLEVEISLLEFSSSVLKKVRISGGGRCNVTHHLFEPSEFCKRYPRGAKELRASFERFQARDTVQWFKERGVNLVAEEDGRMFPSTNTSETIIDCFLSLAQQNGVNVLLNHRVSQITKNENEEFIVQIEGKPEITADVVMIATGSSPQGYKLVKGLGHTITDLAPSLFSFVIKDKLLEDLSGVSFFSADLKLLLEDKKTFKEKGPMLITHWGLSGPAVLKISAWSAREMKQANYKGKLIVNWLGLQNIEKAMSVMQELKDANIKAQVNNAYPEGLTKRFWLKLLERANVPTDRKYADLSKKDIMSISQALFSCEFVIDGKNRYKDEFVECGGVALKEIDFRKMESKVCKNLYFSGEVLDIDGITGGFNFQNAWTGSWIAAHNMILQ